tara:strand:- start:12609 stop:12821 length:213 start_codon:yes stop_codon:yes gene_type:complete
MNLYEIVMEVLEHADDNGMSIKDDMSKQSIATEIYELFYESQVYSSFIDSGYMNDLSDYWQFRQDLDEDE